MAAFSPRSKRGRELARLRREAEAAVEQLLALLDELDGDPDLEPSLGAAEEHPFGGILGATRTSKGSQGLWDAGNRDDREGDDSDDEPSLGAPEVFLGRKMVDGTEAWPDQHQVIDDCMCQLDWCCGSDSDLEAEHDGRENLERAAANGGFGRLRHRRAA
jgi:hypothetical protein